LDNYFTITEHTCKCRHCHPGDKHEQNLTLYICHGNSISLWEYIWSGSDSLSSLKEFTKWRQYCLKLHQDCSLATSSFAARDGQRDQQTYYEGGSNKTDQECKLTNLAPCDELISENGSEDTMQAILWLYETPASSHH